MTILTFPTLSGLAFPVKKSPTFQSIMHTSVSGVTTAQSPQSNATYSYDLPFEFLRSDNVNLELQTLLAFYSACRGRGLPFHFNDPDDNTVVNQTIGVGDGVTTAFALVRTLVSTIDPIQDAVAAGMAVRVSGSAVAFTTLASAQYSTIYGVNITPAPSVGQLIQADFTYNFLCRFGADSLEFSKFMGLIWEATSVKFSSVIQ